MKCSAKLWHRHASPAHPVRLRTKAVAQSGLLLLDPCRVDGVLVVWMQQPMLQLPFPAHHRAFDQNSAFCILTAFMIIGKQRLLYGKRMKKAK